MRLSLNGELLALLTKEIPPDAVPAACGAKVTVNGTLCPDWMVTGKLIPLTEKPVPCQLALETVIGDEPAVSFLV